MAVNKAYALKIHSTLNTFLDQIQVPFSVKGYDQELHDASLNGIKERGISLEGPSHIGVNLRLGVTITSIAYGHIPDLRTRVYIVLHTAAAAALEDVLKDDIGLLGSFCDRYFRSIPHGNPILDACDLLFREMPLHYDRAPADMMILADMDFVVGCMMEYETRRKPISPYAEQFPVFLRNMTAIPTTYAIFAFSPTLPFSSYVETIPSIGNFINYVNDVLSLYKEELEDETVNTISTIARCTGKTKLEALKYLAGESIKAHNETLAVLRDRPEALAAYQAFARGYVHYHTTLKRYKLAELWKMASEEQERSNVFSWLMSLLSTAQKHLYPGNDSHLFISLRSPLLFITVTIMIMMASFVLALQGQVSGALHGRSFVTHLI